MQSTERLQRVEAISQEQIRTLRKLLDGDGMCKCGRYLSPMSAKFILCNAVSQHPQNPNLHGAIIMAAYCYDCAKKINGLLASLSNRTILSH